MIPRPVDTVICAVCELGWESHLNQVRYFDEEDNEYFEEVTLAQCVALLRRRYHGAPGIQGPPGPAGLAGLNEAGVVAVIQREAGS